MRFKEKVTYTAHIFNRKIDKCVNGALPIKDHRDGKHVAKGILGLVGSP